MFKPAKLRERQCIAAKANGEQCSGDISKGALCQATRQIGKVLDGTDKGAITLEIIRLLVCGRHGSSNIEPQLEFLRQQYADEIFHFAQSQAPVPDIIVRPSSRNTRMTLMRKLHEDIKPDQFLHGTIYAYTWNGLPGYVKVGCAKNGCDKRAAQWAKCYPRLVLEYHIDFAFPQRMEEMIHLLLPGRRFEVDCENLACPSGYHDEWFDCSVGDVRKLAEELNAIGEKASLYDVRTRQLTAFWKDALSSSEELYVNGRANDAVFQAMLECSNALDSNVLSGIQRLTLEGTYPDAKTSA